MAKCLLCSTPNNKYVFSLEEYSVYRCQNCNHYYVHPQPSTENLSEMYAKNYYLDGEPTGFQKHLSDGSEEAFRSIKELCLKIKPNGKLLDIGASYGTFLSIMSAAGYEVEGIELSPGAVRYANEVTKVKVSEGTLETHNFAPDSFDIVSINNVLEHIPNPIRTIEQIYQILKPGGFVLIIVPNVIFALPFLKWNILLKGRQFQFNPKAKFSGLTMDFQALTHFDIPVHLHFFSPKTLSRLLKNTGFKRVNLFNAFPVHNPEDKLKTVIKHLVFSASNFIRFITFRKIIISYSLMAIGKK